MAVTLRACDIVTVQVPVPEQPLPLHPWKIPPLWLSVTTVARQVMVIETDRAWDMVTTHVAAAPEQAPPQV